MISSITDSRRMARKSKDPAMDKRVFLATPISGFAAQNEYLVFKKNALRLAAFLRSEGYEVYSEMERIDCADDYESPAQSVEDDFGKISDSEYFVLLHPARMQTSSLIEFGYACAENKKIIAVGRKSDLPYFVIGYAEYSDRARVVEAEEPDDDCFRRISEALMSLS